MSGQQIKSPSMDGLSSSQVWCDVFNFLAGLCCIFNGFRATGIQYQTHHDYGMLVLAGKKNVFIIY